MTDVSGSWPDDAELCDRLRNIADAIEDDEGELYDERALVPLVTPDTQAIHEAAARITALRVQRNALVEAATAFLVALDGVEVPWSVCQAGIHLRSTLDRAIVTAQERT